jgi:PAS domain S-box-containing protein
MLIFGIFIIPAFGFGLYFSNLPRVYVYLFFATSLYCIVYSVIALKVNFFRKIVEESAVIFLSVLSLFCIQDLAVHQFETISIICFLLFFTACLLAMQKFLYIIIYSVVVLFSIIFNCINSDIALELKQLLIGGIFIQSVFSALIYFSRNKKINQVFNFAEYLRNFVDQKGRGYVLFKIAQNYRELVDMSTEVQNLLTIGNGADQSFFWSIFEEDELQTLIKLKHNNYFQKYFHFTTDAGEYRSIRIDVSVMTLRNDNFLQAVILDATDVVLKKQEKEQNEKKYKNLYERNLAGVFTMDLESKILDCNAAFYEILNNEVQIGDFCFSGKSKQVWKELVTLVEVNDNIKNYQVEYILNSGEKKILVFNIYFDKIENALEGTLVDVTDLQKATTALQQSEEKFRTLYEDSNDAIFLLDGENIIEANRKALDIFGYDLFVLQSKTLWELSKSDTEVSKKEFERYFSRLVKNKKVQFPWHFLKVTGKTIEAQVQITTLKIGEQEYNQCLIHDNTERNRNITNLQRSQQGFKSIIDNTPEGFIILQDENCIYANPEAFNLLEMENRELGKINILKLFMSDSQQVFTKLLQQHRYTKESVQKQLYLKSKELFPREVEVSMVSTNYMNEEVVLIILKDLSAQNKLNREKIRASVAEEGKRKLEKEIQERIKAENQLKEQYLRNKAIFDSSSNTLMTTLNKDFKFTQFNTHTEKFIKHILHRDVQEGESMQEVFGSVFSKKDFVHFRRQLRKVLKGEYTQFESQIDYSDEYPNLWVEIFLNPITDSKGEVYEVSMVAHDITEKKLAEKEVLQSLKEKEILLKEVHHRVKNNLQVISSILNLQSSFVTDEKILDILEESRNRIRSMAIIHENLYQTSNFSSINFTNYLGNLTRDLISSYQVETDKVELKLDLQQVGLVLDQAIPCGLMINEIITNALKYAFPNGKKGTVNISMTEEKEIVTLRIEDNGIGLPKGFNYLESETLGLQLVATLVEQLEGELVLESDGGTKYCITFEKQKP